MPRAGGWNNQPLSLLAKFYAYNLTYDAYTSNADDENPYYDMTKLNATQRDIVRWIEND